MHARVLSVRGGLGRLLSVSGRGLWIKERGGPWSVEEGKSPSCSSLHSDGESGGAIVGQSWSGLCSCLLGLLLSSLSRLIPYTFTQTLLSAQHHR